MCRIKSVTSRKTVFEQVTNTCWQEKSFAQNAEKMAGRSGTSQNKTVYYYYTCSTKGCQMPNIRADVLEQAVLVETNKILSNKKL